MKRRDLNFAWTMTAGVAAVVAAGTLGQRAAGPIRAEHHDSPPPPPKVEALPVLPLDPSPVTERDEPAIAVLDYPLETATEASLVQELPPLVDRWAAQFPREAARWVESLPDGLARDLAAATVANRQARTNPMLAAVWLKSFPGIEDLLRDP